MKWLYKAYALVTGKNAPSTPVSLIQEQLQEKRPLPVGVAEFHEWSDRIISGAMLTATSESQKFALANVLLNLGPTIAYETDLYFIHVLRKHAVNQVADAMRAKIRDEVKSRMEADNDNKVLENQ